MIEMNFRINNPAVWHGYDQKKFLSA